jgi:hypothetical protein
MSVVEKVMFMAVISTVFPPEESEEEPDPHATSTPAATISRTAVRSADLIGASS